VSTNIFINITDCDEGIPTISDCAALRAQDNVEIPIFLLVLTPFLILRRAHN
jgi:hypothetical protein